MLTWFPKRPEFPFGEALAEWKATQTLKYGVQVFIIYAIDHWTLQE